MHYYIFEVSFVPEPDGTEAEVDNVPTICRHRAVFKTDLDHFDPTLIERFQHHANINEGDTVQYIGEIMDPNVLETLHLWMQFRTTLDPSGILSDE